MPAPYPFVIVADLRTGSTLLSTSLGQDPEICCWGELFHPLDLPDNQATDHRSRQSAAELIRAALAQPGATAAGFRAMVFLPRLAQRQWSDAWMRLSQVQGLRVIYLRRCNRLAQYASAEVARRAGVYHPPTGDPILEPENRPTITADPQRLRAWVQERDDLFARRRAQLQGHPSLEVSYEQLTSKWTETLEQVQRFLRVEPRTIAPYQRRQEQRPLSDVIANYSEVRHWDSDVTTGAPSPARV